MGQTHKIDTEETLNAAPQTEDVIEYLETAPIAAETAKPSKEHHSGNE